MMGLSTCERSIKAHVQQEITFDNHNWNYFVC